MLADGMTKLLPRIAFEDKRRRLGILELQVSGHSQEGNERWQNEGSEERGE